MSRAWKPGDVVTATVMGRENVRLVAGWSRYEPRLRWCEMSPRWGDGDDDECWFMPSQVTDHRPLVVIDPEDREQVERLVRLFDHEVDGRSVELAVLPVDIDDMQAALREFANPTPPKPDEPMGLGAVVEDADGANFTRVGVDCWVRRGGGLLGFGYSEISAVRVLSEGVTP